ncbi:hypothetical protein DB30_02447 [Enhygromyxa salina]|uniref:Cytochrome C Planctomycete-type domain-containing protein n=1 Tax=Enhygromyxa salina TaxID=215803 RepID=A0A0C2CV87_9BACT|nr:hypothetical protein DB30_02447 [Enhygromyxa salina]
MGFVLLTACESPIDDAGDSAATDTSTSTSTSTETGGETPEFAAEIQPILESACLCHFSPANGDDMSAPYLTLNAGVGLGELVGVDAVQVPGMKRVVPGDIQNSYLVHKLRGTHVDVGGPADTDPMPPLLALDETQITTIEAWIAGGAPG